MTTSKRNSNAAERPGAARAARILISGYYGFSNLGDEAILTSVQKALLQQNSAAELTVLSANPGVTRQSHGVHSLSRTDFAAIWNALGSSDLLISGGGSLLQDVTSSRSLRYYLFILLLAILRRCPFMIYAQGIGPLNGKWNRRLTAFILQRARVITVRDAESVEELQRLGLKAERIRLSADPVLLFPRPEAKLGEQLLRQLQLQPGSGPLIGVSVRPWGDNEKWVEQLALTLDRLIVERKARIVFIPMQEKDDEKISETILARLQNQQQAAVLPGGHHVEEVISLIDACDLLIGVRLHALIFAAVAQTKAIAVRYDPKVEHFARRVRQTTAGNLLELRSEELYALVTEQLDSGSTLGEAEQQTLNRLREQAMLSAQLAFAAIEEDRHE
ncbi:MAG: polysaccharide pyruvyl transferase CsaB [Negativicutes bacterium]|nr:polysaccharide pyruvyl transferase CsaB [Negativicutes bacterium]